MKGTGEREERKGTFCQRKHHKSTKQQSNVNPKRHLSQASWIRYLTVTIAHVKGVSPGNEERLAKIALVNKHTF